MFIAAAIIGTLLTIAFLGAGGAKLAGAPAMREAATHLGIQFSQFRVIGALEVLGALGLTLGIWLAEPAPRVGIAAAVGLCLVAILAFVTHRRAGDPIAQAMPPLVIAAITVVFIALRLASA